MLNLVARRAYSTVKHTHTHKVFNKLFQNKINIDPSKSSAHDLRSQMALYLIDNKDQTHRNHPELLFELQQHHAVQRKSLGDFKKKVEDELKKINGHDAEFLNSLFLLGMDYKADELLNTHRRQIRKVDEVKHQSPDFWGFKLPEE